MAARNPNRDKALELYAESKGKITNREIAAQLGEDEKKIAVWKQRDKWAAVVQQRKRSTTKRAKPTEAAYFEILEDEPPETPGPESKAKSRGGTPGNQNGAKHGLMAKYIPAETLAIMQAFEETSAINILWNNIQLQYAAIIRAQQIMFVADRDDLTRTMTGHSSSSSIGSDSESTTYNIQQAWDKQAGFLQAQSRAMTTLQSMIRQYDELTRTSLTTEEQRLRIEKLKADIARTETDDTADGMLRDLLSSFKARKRP